MAGEQSSEVKPAQEMTAARQRLALAKEKLAKEAAAVDWRDYLKAYPGTAVGAAVLAGLIAGSSKGMGERLAEVVIRGLEWDMLRRSRG